MKFLNDLHVQSNCFNTHSKSQRSPILVSGKYMIPYTQPGPIVVSNHHSTRAQQIRFMALQVFPDQERSVCMTTPNLYTRARSND